MSYCSSNAPLHGKVVYSFPGQIVLSFKFVFGSQLEVKTVAPVVGPVQVLLSPLESLFVFTISVLCVNGVCLQRHVTMRH